MWSKRGQKFFRTTNREREREIIVNASNNKPQLEYHVSCNCPLLTCKLQCHGKQAGGGITQPTASIFLRGIRHVGKTGRGWRFLFAFEEVQEERGGTPGSEHGEETHSCKT